MRLSIITVLLSLGIASCQKPRTISTVSDAENSSEIFVKSIAKSGSISDWLIALPSDSDFDRAAIAQVDDPAKIRAGAAQYKSRLEGVELPGTNKTFFLASDISEKIGMAFAIRVWNSSDTSESAWRVILIKDPNAPASDFTEGSGGRKGEIFRAAFASTNDKGSSDIRVFAPTSNSPTNPQPLIVWLHGDTGSNYDNQTAPEQYRAFHQANPTIDQTRAETLRENLWNEVVFAAVKSPSRDANDMLTWSTNLSQAQLANNADFLNEVITQKLFKDYNIDTRKVFIFGQSGGGIFLGEAFIPIHGNSYRGGFGMLCGADRPHARFNFTPSATFKQRVKIHIESTTQETRPLQTSASNARDYYREVIGSESPVTFVADKQGTHCQFGGVSQPQIMAPLIKSMSGANGYPL